MRGCWSRRRNCGAAVQQPASVTQQLTEISVDSNGHGCMLQYALLHLFGYDLSLQDIKDFRV